MVRRSSRRRRSQNYGLAAFGLIAVLLVLVGVSLSREAPPAQAVTRLEPVMVGTLDTVKVLVPREYVPAGTRVKNMRVEPRNFPADAVSPAALHSLDDLQEWVTNVPLGANLPIERTHLRSPDSFMNPVVEKIPDGMRAMTITVDATASVEGWAGTGNRVDVILIEKDRTSVVAEKVRILSTERSTRPVEQEGSHHVPSTVTLLVTQEQCLAISTAIPKGKISFALRNFNDDESWSRKNFTPEDLRGGPANSERESEIKAYVVVKEGRKEGGKGYVLSDGKWIRSDVRPEGFFPSEE